MVVLPKKRERESELDTITTMANYLMLLSSQENHFDNINNSPNRVFECKTCNRQFSSFQALGGHRARHKKPRLMGELNYHQLPTSPPKPKTHECSICGLEFPIGQALGGHMRRHRAMLNENKIQVPHHVVKKSNNCRRVLCLDLNLTPFGE
uniref:Zinc finger protein ZAT12-like n=1 Tax=Nicotiana tabacum TaxID=4097 RepID=A0A1S4CLV3_TOBAC|nr:PREDICTED: zinc finger protein ZAT12-like [Nicotiana tabacum]